MSVYIDDMKAPYGFMKMSHMIADTVEELHEMADNIGIKRKWFQGQASFPHYDICQSKKKEAVDCFGAIPVTQRELALKIRELKKAQASSSSS